MNSDLSCEKIRHHEIKFSITVNIAGCHPRTGWPSAGNSAKLAIATSEADLNTGARDCQIEFSVVVKVSGNNFIRRRLKKGWRTERSLPIAKEDIHAGTGGNRRQAARILGISRSTLLSKLRRYEAAERRDTR